MREIKFRGMCTRGKWIYGYYVKTTMSHTGHVIIPGPDGFGNIPVLPETVGQFTGLVDVNGVDIYEGDVIERDRNCLFDDGRCKGTVRFKDGAFRIGEAQLLILVQGFNVVVVGNTIEGEI